LLFHSPGQLLCRIDTKVTLKFYKKPEKKKSPSRTLIGSWDGYYRKSPICLKIRSVDVNGNFIAQLIWRPKKHKSYYFNGATSSVEGKIKGNNIFFQEIKTIKGTGLFGVGKGENKYTGDWNTNHMTIKEKYFLWSSKKR
jgi:hypothetical protein